MEEALMAQGAAIRKKTDTRAKSSIVLSIYCFACAGLIIAILLVWI